jgi:nucleoid DNA-binding protein
MTLRDFVNRIAAATGVPKVRVDQVLDLFLDEITDSLARDHRVHLRNFGVFRTVDLPARTGRNPRTGEPVHIPASQHVRFRAGKRMRDKLNP